MTAERLLIRGGTVIDGAGGEPYVADVLLADGVIAAVGTELTPGRCGQAGATETGITQIDATGLLVTRGFIDVHTHYDGQATWEHTLGPSSGTASPPWSWATAVWASLRAVPGPVTARSGRGVLQVITEFPAPDLVPDRMRLLIGLARASGRPLSFTLAQFHSAPRSWPEVLRRTEEAHAAGVPIRGQVSPGRWGSSWASTPAGTRSRPARRTRPPGRLRAGPRRQRRRPRAGAGVSPAEIAYDIMLERDGQGMLWAGFANIIDGSLEPALAMMRSRLQGRPQPHRLRHA